MKMRKIISVALSVLMLVSLAVSLVGCGDGGDGKTEEIKVWTDSYSYSDDKKSLQNYH